MKHFYREDKDILDLMEARHSVRLYKDKKLSHEQVTKLRECIDECNAESGLHIFLVTEEFEAFTNMAARYGHFGGVRNYIVIAGKGCPDFD